MRNFFFSLTVLIGLMAIGTQAQAGGCTSDTTCTGTFGAICPSTMPAAEVGVFYAEMFTYYTPDSIKQIDLADLIPGAPSFTVSINAPVMEASLQGVNNLPDGLSLAYCNSTTCSVVPGNNGGWDCFVVSGTICDLEAAGSQTVVGIINLKLDLSNFTLPFPIPGVTVPDTVDLPTPVQLSMDVTSAYAELGIAKDPNTDYLCPNASQDLYVASGYDSYNWSTGGTDTAITINSPGTYWVEVTFGGGSCTATDTIVIEPFNLTLAYAADTICKNQITVLEAMGADTYSWSPSANLSDATVANPVVYDLTTTTTFQVIASSGGCSDTNTVTIVVDTMACAATCDECVVNRSCTLGASARFCPSTISVSRNVAYQGNTSFSLPDSITLQTIIDQLGLGALPIPIPTGQGVAIDELEITGISDLPSGLSWEVDQASNDNVYYPALAPLITRFGCVSFCGTTCDKPGTVTASLDVSITVTVPAQVPQVGGTQQSFPLSFDFDFNIQGTAVSITPDGPTDILQGDSVTLDASGSSFSNFQWSTGETTASITVSTAGVYTVTVTDDEGCTQTDEVEVTILSSVADLNSLEASLNIYPNPNTGAFSLTYNLNKAQDVTLFVVDITGKVVYTENILATAGENNQQLNLDVASGVYFVRLQTVDGAVNSRIAIQ